MLSPLFCFFCSGLDLQRASGQDLNPAQCGIFLRRIANSSQLGQDYTSKETQLKHKNTKCLNKPLILLEYSRNGSNLNFNLILTWRKQ